MNRYEVISDFTAKTPEGIKELKKGQTIKLPEQSAKQLLEAGKIKPLPYLDNGVLRIPFDSPNKYHWWNRGQSVLDTLKELKASEKITKRYKFYSN
ncbi:MAG: hypothetical protein AYP45_08700 [Candidatus Brocadia carolinensis]|uniref:Uncharacterized protein n=1 Tax=Candidatus Brocadia carolinensis TaxID=1004156 RepID=A0A1V4ATN2_9BACT|nr:MAG: hypothetical protein AYP45_08700 [Candidatus Brocadia caroliniensis]